nr:hypothetical protein GCM10025732_08100 [Glycomyces mayteni]
MERRSRLSAERETEIFGCVERLVREHGYENVTMQQIAAEARTSTATLYRHWNGKPRLVVEAVRNRRPAPWRTSTPGASAATSSPGPPRSSSPAPTTTTS